MWLSDFIYAYQLSHNIIVFWFESVRYNYTDVRYKISDNIIIGIDLAHDLKPLKSMQIKISFTSMYNPDFSKHQCTKCNGSWRFNLTPIKRIIKRIIFCYNHTVIQVVTAVLPSVKPCLFLWTEHWRCQKLSHRTKRCQGESAALDSCLPMIGVMDFPYQL